MIYGGYEITQTNFNHPDITTGQHTNGPAAIWIRYKDGPWVNTHEKRMHKVREAIDIFSSILIEGLQNDLT